MFFLVSRLECMWPVRRDFRFGRVLSLSSMAAVSDASPASSSWLHLFVRLRLVMPRDLSMLNLPTLPGMGVPSSMPIMYACLVEVRGGQGGIDHRAWTAKLCGGGGRRDAARVAGCPCYCVLILALRRQPGSGVWVLSWGMVGSTRFGSRRARFRWGRAKRLFRGCQEVLGNLSSEDSVPPSR